MRPEHYVDIVLRGGAGVTVPVLAGKTMQVLHGVYARTPGRFATALPAMKHGEAPTPGHIVRVFSESGDDLDRLADAVEGVRNLRAFLTVARIKRVPDDTDPRMEEYRRFRIPSRKGKSPEHQEKRMRLRLRRVTESQEMPYVMLHSGSTGQSFSMFVLRVSPSEPGTIGEPDSYGLSRSTVHVPLPVIQ